MIRQLLAAGLILTATPAIAQNKVELFEQAFQLAYDQGKTSFSVALNPGDITRARISATCGDVLGFKLGYDRWRVGGNSYKRTCKGIRRSKKQMVKMTIIFNGRGH